MKNASPFILVKDVRESVDYYQSIFGGDINMLNEHAGKLLHAELHLGSSLIHFADTYGQQNETKDANVILQFDSEDEIRSVYDKLTSDGGKIQVKLADTFFGALHGQVTDSKNGISWVLNQMKSILEV
jgi:PhnB protein